MRRWALVLAVVAAVAAGALATTALGSHQPPGCTSTAAHSGALTSPSLDFGNISAPFIQFETWWEIESAGPVEHDLLRVQVSTNGGLTWNPGVPATLNAGAGLENGGPQGTPVSDEGLQERPAFGPESEFVNINEAGLQSDVRIRFVFDTVDTFQNGYRGWGIDDVAILDGSTTRPIAEGSFEGSLSGWTTTGFWHVVDEAQGLGLSPEAAALVSLGPGDDGTLPADPNGARFAWFGEDITGTYCGADALHDPDVTPPAVTLTSPSNGSSVSDTTPTFSGAAGDAAGDSSTVTVDVFTGSTASGSPAQTLTTSRSGAAWSVTADTPLAPGVYTARATQTDVAGNVGQSAPSTFTISTPPRPDPQVLQVRQARDPFPPDIVTAPTLDALPDPEFGEINVGNAAGRVFVRLPGGRGGAARASQAGVPTGFIPLTQAAQVPVNSIIETLRGRASLESIADARGRRMQRADFFGGRFQVRQKRSRRPITEMVLKGGSFRGCPRASKSSSADPRADASQRRGRRVRRVWGNGRGRFRTRGRYSSATVRGTTWLTEDTCNGTLTRVARRPRTNRVVVRDLVQRRSRLLHAGQSYFAARPLRSR